MKYLLVLFLFTCTFSYGQVRVSEELKVRADKIRDELLNGKSLPPKIENFGSSNNGHSSLRYLFHCSIIRTENNIDDSIALDISIMDDSLKDMQFSEVYLKNGKEGRQFSYAINKYGIIDWAYRTEAPKADPKVIQQNGSTTYIPDNQPIIEISSSPFYPTPKNIDEKKIAIYKDRLKVTVEELYDILFKK